MTCDRWQVRGDMWHMTRGRWHLAPDTWHLVWDEHSLKISAPYLFRFAIECVFEDILTKGWINTEAQPAYGRNQVVVGIAQETLESSSNRGTGCKKKFGDNFVPFESPQIQLNQFEYLVRCSLVQLCVSSERGRDTASPSALYHWTGLAKVGFTGNHCRLCQSAYE